MPKPLQDSGSNFLSAGPRQWLTKLPPSHHIQFLHTTHLCNCYQAGFRAFSSPTVQSSALICPPFLQAVSWLSGNMCPACAHVTITAAQATPTSKHILATVSDKLGKAIATGCPEILSHKADSTLSASQQVYKAGSPPLNFGGRKRSGAFG